MANALYAAAKEKFLRGEFDWLLEDFRAVLIDLDNYTVDFSADEFLDDIPSGARVATSPNLSGKTVTAGVADAANLTFTNVSGARSEAVVIYRETGLATTSDLIAYLDEIDTFPVTPNGGNITLLFSEQGIFFL